MPKVLFFSDPSNGRPGLGATIQLDSGEHCLMSIAPGWVRVKKSRAGFFGSTLYNVRNLRETTQTANALIFLFPDSLLPSGFTEPMLCAFANAILHCSTCDEVAAVLKEAVARAEQKAALGRKIISDFAAFITSNVTKPDAFYDVSVLPHPKEAIVSAIEGEIIRAPLNEWIDWLKTGSLFLWNFQRGVGPSPLPLLGEDIAPVPRGDMSPATLDQLRREAHRLVTSPNRQRVEHIWAVADNEAELIDKRIANAIRLRQRRLGF